MDRLIATNSVPLANADTAPLSGTPQYATDGNPATGVSPTLWPAYAWNMIADEIRKVITDAGLTPSSVDWSQLSQAILQRSGGYAADTGTTNAYAVALALAPVALTAGLQIRFSVLHTNTGASTLNVNGLGVKSIVNPDGTALLAGQIWIAGIVTVVYSGTSFVLQSAPAPTALFGSLLSANGFQKLPSGLIIQWAGVSVPGSTTSTFTLPTPFLFATYVIIGGVGIPGGGAFNSGSVSLSQIQIQNTGTSAQNGFYIALGK